MNASGVGSTEPPGSVGSSEPPESDLAGAAAVAQIQRAGAGLAGAGAETLALALRNELVGLGGIVERNLYLTRRYLLWDVAFLAWTIANTLTIVFIARSVGLSPARPERARDEAARRRRDLGVSGDHLRDCHRDGRRARVGGCVAAPPDRRGGGAARPRDLPSRRAVCKAAREAEAVWVADETALVRCRGGRGTRTAPPASAATSARLRARYEARSTPGVEPAGRARRS